MQTKEIAMSKYFTNLM